MKTRLFILFFCMLFFTNTIYAVRTHRIIIYSKSSEFNKDGIIYDSLKSVHVSFYDNLILKKSNKEKIQINGSKVWGVRYSTKYGTITWRHYAHARWYRLVGFDGMAIYYNGNGKSSMYYFSSTLDSKIYPLNFEDLEDVYKTNVEFVNNLELYRKKTHRILYSDITDIYKKSVH